MMATFKSRKLVILESNIDDMNPQWCEPLMEKLFKAGALDVVLIPSIMKKSRPAVVIQVLADPKLRDKILEVIFQESTTLGVRSYEVTRFELKREIRKVKTKFGTIDVKIGRDGSGRILNISPEYESCRKIALQKKIPLKEVFAQCLKKF